MPEGHPRAFFESIVKGENDTMHWEKIKAADNEELAHIARYNLKKHGLDLPGTVYFDSDLDHLSDFYLAEGKKRFYFVLKNDEGDTVGGIGLAEFGLFDHCAELQKLYLADSVKGAGWGYRLISLVEEKARELGYKRIYLETHSNLEAAIHIYEKSGYKSIERPKDVMHATMNRFYMKEL